jgi:hypothetical protein
MNHETRDEGVKQRLDDETPQSVSERKRKANRENAKKSTGPKTTRGKRNSSFNALKHGLLVQRINVQTDEDAERMNQLIAGLYERYASDGDIRNELLLESALVDYWRFARGLDLENSVFSEGAVVPIGLPLSHLWSPGFPANLIRYMTSNHRALIKTFDMLEEARARRICESETENLVADTPPAPARRAKHGGPSKKPPRSYSPEDRENRPNAEASVSPHRTQGTRAA